MGPELVVEARRERLVVVGVLEATKNLIVDLELLPLVASPHRRGRRRRRRVVGSAPAALVVVHHHRKENNARESARKREKMREKVREKPGTGKLSIA